MINLNTNNLGVFDFTSGIDGLPAPILAGNPAGTQTVPITSGFVIKPTSNAESFTILGIQFYVADILSVTVVFKDVNGVDVGGIYSQTVSFHSI